MLHLLYGLENLCLLDLDLEMKAHPDYDQNNPANVYKNKQAYMWANQQVEDKFSTLLTNPKPLVAVDGTGTKVSEAAAAAYVTSSSSPTNSHCCTVCC